MQETKYCKKLKDCIKYCICMLLYLYFVYLAQNWNKLQHSISQKIYLADDLSVCCGVATHLHTNKCSHKNVHAHFANNKQYLHAYKRLTWSARVVGCPRPPWLGPPLPHHHSNTVKVNNNNKHIHLAIMPASATTKCNSKLKKKKTHIQSVHSKL